MAIDPKLKRAYDVICLPWVPYIIDELIGGPKRFGELEHSLGISPKTLTDRLRVLTAGGFVEKESGDPASPYRLSTDGRSIKLVITAMKAWGGEHAT